MSTSLFRAGPAKGGDLYRWIAPIYDPLVGPFLRPVRIGVRRIARELGCRRILDIACGTGEQVQMLAEGDFTAAGVDLSSAMIVRAHARADQRASFLLGDAENLPFAPGSFDCVHISLALHEMDYSSAAKVVENALDVLSADGKLILVDYLNMQDLSSGLSLALLHVVERFAGRRHYRNFKHFVNLGGLLSFIAQFPLRIVSARNYFGGAMGLIVAGR
ncbi:MAG: class I SAM-dependent methyltransferase [Syntrophobacteraceae bacterium]